MAITNPQGVPQAHRAAIKDVCEALGPQVLAKPDGSTDYPTDSDGQPKGSLTQGDVADVFEKITRKFWRDQIVALKANAAAEKARRAEVEAQPADPFEE